MQTGGDACRQPAATVAHDPAHLCEHAVRELLVGPKDVSGAGGGNENGQGRTGGRGLRNPPNHDGSRVEDVNERVTPTDKQHKPRTLMSERARRVMRKIIYPRGRKGGERTGRGYDGKCENPQKGCRGSS